MKTNELINNVVLITLKNKKEFEGILIDISDEWCYIKYIPVDYVVDGFVLINQRYIKNIQKSEEHEFKENILRLKGAIAEKSVELNIGDTIKLLSDMQSKIELIQIELKSPHKCYIGKIDLVKEHSFKVRLLSPKANWLLIESFLYKEIRAIYFDNDYVNSLQLALTPISNRIK
ncbi:small nuclear ribonucleoprotein (snRNP)-like protein [Chryseobacterium bernardetii]|uniref:Uncharacterized protein n=3 Tax=Chryseobacterium TaxID=59732 RepID=A0A543EN64_9FLAO|nr:MULTISPECIES: hypothetical protein [Chryseobacterium]MDR6369408.1 small nuclear ribonucleoprotein (snRNP)-like protein [Chryseobacterium vietnamense]MDR6439670.1 small nuclear ribonucleoprotein (snRNP)-like protein [Chryseobacterium bernardetii]MDR6459254.1 small nuclear ribonucleoprotein (snRNP)-like protein [Chryseobacterium vietnamense]MDR6487695.1 small nuclear ribonucleoprotein (snRNP)-like protein [Chryseobacterium vietnamense]TQM23016.1 hypothetical protein FB551_2745 [Chryseobacteri